jgi:GT2 family glycosyltransferase
MIRANVQPGLVGVVTVTFNSAPVLADFMRSMETQEYGLIRMWAVDNASSDDSLEQLRSWHFPGLQVIASENNVGVAEGNNQGIRAALEAGCEYVLLLNNDVYFEPDLIGELIQGLADHACNMTTPKIYYADEPHRIWAAGGRFRTDFAYLNQHVGDKEIDSGQYADPRPISYAPTCCLLVKREVFEVVGLMDARFFVYFDDTDFMIRALRAGFITYYLPRPQLWHKVSSLTGEESPFSQRYYARNRAFFIRKHLGAWTLARYTLFYRAYYLLRYLRGQDKREDFLRKQRAWSEGSTIL